MCNERNVWTNLRVTMCSDDRTLSCEWLRWMSCLYVGLRGDSGLSWALLLQLLIDVIGCTPDRRYLEHKRGYGVSVVETKYAAHRPMMLFLLLVNSGKLLPVSQSQ